jgi:hypothetical protein
MLKKIGLIASLAVAAAALSSPASAGATAVFHDFEVNNDVQGWQKCEATCTAPTYSATGGDPAGHISAVDSIADNMPSGILSFQHTALGLSTANYGGTWSLSFRTSSPPGFGLGLILYDTSGNYVTKSIPLTGASTDWRAVSAPLTDSAGWFRSPESHLATEAEMKGILGSLARAQIIADVVTGTGETYSLDNVRFTDGPVATTPTPPTPPTPPAAAGPTGQRAAALKKCAKIKSKTRKKKCKKLARQLPV